MPVMPELANLSYQERSALQPEMKQRYPVGSPVWLVGMNNPQDSIVDQQTIKPGEYGLVEGIDSMCHIHVQWCSGSRLALIPEFDDFVVPAYGDQNHGFPHTAHVNIDGDPFLVTVPDFSEFVAIYQRFPKMRNEHGRFLLYRDPARRSAEKEWEAPPSVVVNTTGSVPVPLYTVSGWQPMLVPLTRSGAVSKWLTRFRDGQIIRLGTLAVNGTVVPCKRDLYRDLVDSLHRFWKPGDPDCVQFQLLDSDRGGEPLSWMVWKGTLVSTRLLIRSIECSDLLRQGFLFY